MNLINRKLKKFSSNRGEPTSVSMILWIALAVIVFLGLAALIIPAVFGTGEEIADCIGAFQVGADGVVTSQPCENLIPMLPGNTAGR